MQQTAIAPFQDPATGAEVDSEEITTADDAATVEAVQLAESTPPVEEVL